MSKNALSWDETEHNERIRRLCFPLILLLASAIFTAPMQGAQKATDTVPAPNAKGLDDAMKAMFGVRTFQQAEISPDGKLVAWVESLPGPGGAPSADSAIYVAPLSAPDAAKRITAGDGKAAHEEHDIAWSPDGKGLAFLSDAATNGQLQLFVANLGGGSARQLTHLTGFLASPGWSPDGKTLALLFTENATRAAGPLVAEIPDEGVVSEEFLGAAADDRRSCHGKRAADFAGGYVRIRIRLGSGQQTPGDYRRAWEWRRQLVHRRAFQN